ncbi:MAG: hypothetical protein ACHQAQ_12265, partial [Hyphomicrobiales bacterium]
MARTLDALRRKRLRVPGRSGRAGKSGRAKSLLREQRKLAALRPAQARSALVTDSLCQKTVTRPLARHV